MNLSARDIRERLSNISHIGFQPPTLEFPDQGNYMSGEARQAAVLIPLQCIQGRWHVLLTRRNDNLIEHSGQVAYPGGRMDPEDSDPETTALREAWEETGIQPKDVEILGRLPQFLTITNYLVTPVVGQIPWPYSFSPALDEVSRIFTIPLEWLADSANWEEHQRALPPPFGAVQVIYYRQFDGEILWGASARFTLTFVNLLK